jgi:hypothetical protein
VAVGIGVAVGAGVAVGSGVGVEIGVAVGSGVGVDIGVAVATDVGVETGVDVDSGVGASRSGASTSAVMVGCKTSARVVAAGPGVIALDDGFWSRAASSIWLALSPPPNI